MNGTIDGRWLADRANQWYASQPWPVGCNFLPSTAINSVEMWQEESFDAATIDRELSWAAGLGFNSVRVFLQFVVWDADSDGFLDRFDRFLSMAAAHGMTVMPLPFDDCCFSHKEPRLGPQDDPRPGIHNSGWVPSPGKALGSDRANYPRLERYVTELLTRYGRDPRVIVWDLYNEPGANDQFDSRDLLAETYRWARAADPDQPLTTGVFKATMDGTQTFEEIAGSLDLNRFMLDNSDVLSFHNYCDMDWARASVKIFREAHRPLFCTEWMARGPMGSFFQTHLPFWKEHKVACYNWGMVAGRTQTYLPWSSLDGQTEPEVWHHDILRTDGTPYDPEEISAIRQCTGVQGDTA